jgi:hypothetical protein
LGNMALSCSNLEKGKKNSDACCNLALTICTDKKSTSSRCCAAGPAERLREKLRLGRGFASFQISTRPRALFAKKKSHVCVFRLLSTKPAKV